MKRTKMAKCTVSEEVVELAEMLSIIAEVNRLRILCLLFTGEKCVCDIEKGLSISQPLASHHLSVLRNGGLVHLRKQAAMSFYSLNRKTMGRINKNFQKILGTEKLSREYRHGAACANG